MNQITEEAVAKVRGYVINQARYQCPAGMYGDLWEDMCEVADDMTDEQTEEFLLERAILDDINLIKLVENITLAELYDEDGWVDDVANYIVDYKDDCLVLWNTLASKCES